MDEHPSTLTEWVERPHKTCGAVLLEHRQVFTKLGLTNPPKQRLGRGAFGQAFEVNLPGKSVLKLTRDPYEAIAAYRLVGKTLKHVVPIYGIWIVPNTVREGCTAWFLVHRGYLNKLSKPEGTLMDLLYTLYHDEDSPLHLPRPEQHAVRSQWRNAIRRQVYGEEYGDEEEGPTNMSRDQRLKKSLMMLEQVSKGSGELAKVGIDWKDFHSGNMMKDAAGIYRIADVGWGMTFQETEQEIPEFTADGMDAYVRERMAA